MYLSRLILNPRNRQVCAELERPYQLHRTLLRAFPHDLPAQAERVLFRLDEVAQRGELHLLVQSQQLPDWGYLGVPGAREYLAQVFAQENPAVKEVNYRLLAGQVLSFRLLANPTKRLSRSLTRGMETSKRVGIYASKEQIEWLQRKGEQHGFRLLSAQTGQQARRKDQRPPQAEDAEPQVAHDLQFLSVRFDGMLAVVDPARLQTALAQGIGSGKAFGFGLLSLAPAH